MHVLMMQGTKKGYMTGVKPLGSHRWRWLKQQLPCQLASNYPFTAVWLNTLGHACAFNFKACEDTHCLPIMDTFWPMYAQDFGDKKPTM